MEESNKEVSYSPASYRLRFAFWKDNVEVGLQIFACGFSSLCN